MNWMTKMYGLLQVASSGDFQPVAWIENDADCWFDTGVVPTDTFGVMCKITMADVTTDRFLAGLRTQSNTNSRVIIGVNNGAAYFGWGGAITYNNVASAVYANTEFEAKLNYLNDRRTRVNGEISNTATLGTLFSNPTYSFILMGRNYAGTTRGVAQKLSAAEITDGSNVTHSYQPGYLRSTGEILLYDSVTNTYLHKSGTGTLTKGADI